MARGRKSLTLEERLEKVNTLIQENEDAIKKLKAEKKQLEEEIENKKLKELHEIVIASGKTLDEIKEMLSK